MTKELKQEYTLRISEANSTQMVVIIYEMLEIYISETRQALRDGQIEEFHEGIKRCTACIRELSASVLPDSPLSGNLQSLYIFCMKELSLSDVHHTENGLIHADAIIKKLHGAFKVVADNDDSPAVMGNTQRVYAGLTYGKESLVVHLQQDNNRGYMV